MLEAQESVAQLEIFSRTSLSNDFYMREFMYSEVASVYGINNIPDDTDAAIYSGEKLCSNILEPLQTVFGRISVRSGYRSSSLNAFCHENGLTVLRIPKLMAGISGIFYPRKPGGEQWRVLLSQNWTKQFVMGFQSFNLFLG